MPRRRSWCRLPAGLQSSQGFSLEPWTTRQRRREPIELGAQVVVRGHEGVTTSKCHHPIRTGSIGMRGPAAPRPARRQRAGLNVPPHRPGGQRSGIGVGINVSLALRPMPTEAKAVGPTAATPAPAPQRQAQGEQREAKVRSPEGAAEEDEGPVRREEDRGDSSDRRGVDTRKRWTRPMKRTPPNGKSPRVASNSAATVRGPASHPTARVDDDQQGQCASAMTTDDIGRVVAMGGPDRGGQERMVRHGIGTISSRRPRRFVFVMRCRPGAGRAADRGQDPSCGGE